jgi:hypothetical protein
LSFDTYNRPLKIWESIGTPTPKVGAPWECEGSFRHTFLHSWEHEMWLLTSFLAHTLASPSFGHGPKTKVVITRASKTLDFSLLWLPTITTCKDLSSLIHKLVIIKNLDYYSKYRNKHIFTIDQYPLRLTQDTKF